MKSIFALLFIGASSAAFAYEEPKDIPIEKYRYGMELDVKKLIYVTPTPKDCALHSMVVDYLDSDGVRHRVEYRMLGNGCKH